MSSYVPIACNACGRVALLRMPEAQHSPCHCALCGGIARVVPGGNYVEGDVTLFTGLSRAVAEAALSPADAEKLVLGVQDACADGSQRQVVASLLASLPALTRAHPVIVTESDEQRHALRMLATILEAGVLVHPSGEMALHQG